MIPTSKKKKKGESRKREIVAKNAFFPFEMRIFVSLHFRTSAWSAFCLLQLLVVFICSIGSSAIQRAWLKTSVVFIFAWMSKGIDLAWNQEIRRPKKIEGYSWRKSCRLFHEIRRLFSSVRTRQTMAGSSKFVLVALLGLARCEKVTVC